MPNIIKPLYYLLLIIGITQNLYSQVLFHTNFTPTPGAKINDIANVYANDINEQTYLIVGDFTSVNGNSSNGLAFIRKDDYQVTAPPRFDSVLSANFTQGSEIKTAQYYKKTISNNGGGLDTVEYIFICGTFQEVEGNIHVGLCLFKSINNSSFLLDSWDADLGWNANFNVNSSVIKNDSLFISGHFFWTENGTYDPNGLNSFAVFDLATFTGSDFGLVYNSNLNSSTLDPIEIKNVNNNIISNNYVGSGSINRNIISFNNFTPVSIPYPLEQQQFNISNFTDSTYIVNYANYGNTPSLVGRNLAEVRKLNGQSISNSIWYNDNQWNPYMISMSPKYKNNLYFFGEYFLTQTNNLNSNKKLWSRNINDSNDVFFASYKHSYIPNGKINIIENKMFLITDADSINNTKVNGLAIFCLEPMDVEFLSDFDTTVCAGQDSILYAVDSVGFATSFKWEYSGTGMIIHQNSGTQPLDTLTPTSSHITGDSIYVKFGSDFTPGTLKITALSECGEPSKPYSVNIISNPLPQVYAGLDTTLNCVRDTVILIGSSITSNVTYKWNPFSFPSTIGTNDTITNNGEYIFEVKDSIGCTNYDTVLVTMDTIAPVANPITEPDFITCAISSRVFTGTTVNPASTDSIYWRLDTNYFSNPITASQPGGTYHLIALNKINGCADSSQNVMLNDSSNPPNIQIQGYPNIYSTIGSIETITCSNDTLNLITVTSTPNTVINWTSADSSQLYGSQLEITEAGTYYIKAINTDNGCPAYKSIIIDIDTIKPLTSITPMTFTELSCSLDSLTLIGGSPSSSTNSHWTGPNNYVAPNSAIINTPGTYYINVNDINNGCTNIDSITIEYNPKILVSIGNDTVACNQESVMISSSYIGANITGLNYSWNNGSVNTTASYTAGIDSLIILELTGDNSCYGTDTLVLTIPPTPEVSISSFKPCGAGTDGQIVVTPTSGWTPFTYSIDNGVNFQNSGVFNNLAYGNYIITVQDSLNCIYDFSTAINENSNLPTPLFLVQTYNFSSDTVILVDVSSPPTDSSSWIFPSGIQVIDYNSLAPVIVLPDTGSFDVTMKGYYGACNVDITKTVYAIDYDSTFATSSNANGIKSMQLYPNPNTGNFNIEIEFFKKQQAAITIQDVSGNGYFFSQYGEVDEINEYISLTNAINGTYILKIVSEFDSRYITFIITQ